jgi:hypothetical protein
LQGVQRDKLVDIIVAVMDVQLEPAICDAIDDLDGNVGQIQRVEEVGIAVAGVVVHGGYVPRGFKVRVEAKLGAGVLELLEGLN